MAALVSDWFIDALDPAVESLGISKAFTGLVIVGDRRQRRREHRRRHAGGQGQERPRSLGREELGGADRRLPLPRTRAALAVLRRPRLTFVLNPVFIGALAVTALAIWQITGDGEALRFEGAALVGIYAVLATVTFYE